MAEPQQSKVIVIPRGYTKPQRESIGKDILRRIKRRTSAGIDASGNLFGSYSKNYEKSGSVDLKVSGELLGGLKVISHGVGFIRIGFDNSIINEKAGWIQSPKGQKLGKQPKRQFVGVTQAELNTILENHKL